MSANVADICFQYFTVFSMRLHGEAEVYVLCINTMSCKISTLFISKTENDSENKQLKHTNSQNRTFYHSVYTDSIIVNILTFILQ